MRAGRRAASVAASAAPAGEEGRLAGRLGEKEREAVDEARAAAPRLAREGGSAGAVGRVEGEDARSEERGVARERVGRVEAEGRGVHDDSVREPGGRRIRDGARAAGGGEGRGTRRRPGRHVDGPAARPRAPRRRRAPCRPPRGRARRPIPAPRGSRRGARPGRCSRPTRRRPRRRGACSSRSPAATPASAAASSLNGIVTDAPRSGRPKPVEGLPKPRQLSAERPEGDGNVERRQAERLERGVVDRRREGVRDATPEEGEERLDAPRSVRRRRRRGGPPRGAGPAPSLRRGEPRRTTEPHRGTARGRA